MKHLILIRHAETEEKVTGQTDKDRELTTAGISQAAAVGAFLRNYSVQIDIILSSGAARAATTSNLIAEQLASGTDLVMIEDELYQASVGTLFDIIRNADQYQNLAIVGHNPTVSYFAEFITGTNIEEMRPGCLLVFKLAIGNWKEMQKGSAVLMHRFDA